MTFFFDNNIGENLVRGMKAFGEDVIHLKQHFAEDTPDHVWLEYIGKQGYVLITKDERVRYNPLERRAIKKYRIGTFFLGGKGLDKCRLIQQVVRNWPRIKEYAIKSRKLRPYAFRVPPTGTKFTSVDLTA